MADVIKLFERCFHTCILPNLGQHGVNSEETGIWESVSAVVTNEAHQPIVREIPQVPGREAMEGAYPIDIDCVLSHVSLLGQGGERKVNV